MINNPAYSSIEKKRRMLGISTRQIFLICLILNIAVIMTYAQDFTGEYDEILVYISVPGIGGGEINAVIKGEDLYLPVKDLFDFLKIRNIPDQGMDFITGFFIDQKAEYRIDRVKNNIIFINKTFELEPGSLIRTENNLYLRCDYFKIFGLNCNFNFRNLSVTLKTDLELPAIREMRQEEMRQNLTNLKGEINADTIIGRKYPLFHFGMADWSAIATEYANGQTDARFNLALGSIIAGGETTIGINYSTTNPFTEKQQYYLWRYANNENKALRQVMAGKIATQAISSIYNPVIGIQLTNTPTTFRRSFGSYTLTDITEPGWIVELYVNNVLINYVKADASGFFTFEVPLVYGNTLVVLKFFGPWGEERTREQNISIPFNFIPKNTFEYTVSAGIIEDTLLSRFSRASFNYGLTRGITLGAGMEYVSSITSAPAMPYVNASFRLASNILMSGEYTHNVRAMGKFSFRLPSNVLFEIDYTKFDKDQKAINYNYSEQRKVSVSIPVKMKKLMVYNRLSLDQLVLPTLNYTTSEWMISGSFLGMSTNISTFGLFIGNKKPYVYSNFSLALRLPASITFIPQAQYSYTDERLLSARIRLEKMFFKKAFLNLSYERNIRSNLNLGEIGLRYDFKFAQTGASARQSENSTAFVQYARGSFINNSKTRYLAPDNRMNVGKGGISILPFLDINANGKWDAGEPKVDGLNLHASGGRVEHSEKDTIIRILSLEPYTVCFIEFDEASFENLAWRIKKRTMSVAVDPNMLKVVELPVSVIGEVAGMVTLDKRGDISGLGRMIINFYTKDQKLAGKVLSEEDGYFSYFGLTPGLYDVRLDTAQLQKLGMLSDTSSLDFNIAANIEGDLVDGLDFMVRMKDVDTTELIAVEQSVKADTSYIIIHEGIRELITITDDTWALQLGAFIRRDYAEAYREKVQSLLDKKVELVLEDGFYKLRVIGFNDRKEVDENIAILKESGVTQVWLLTLKAMSQQLLVTETLDSLMRIKEDSLRRVTGVITETMPDTALARFYVDMAIQVGAFRNEAYAVEFRKRIALTVNKDITIVKENGWHKVRITGFESAEDLEKYLPTLGLHGIRDMWIVSVKKAPVAAIKSDSERPVINIRPDSFPVAEKKEAPVLIQPDTSVTIPVEKPDTTTIPFGDQPITPAAPPEPTISLQVALFNKRAQALRAQKRITDKLALPVEIVEQWGYYKVIVTGFYTREETYRFYPELAGLGYPNITLIEEK